MKNEDQHKNPLQSQKLKKLPFKVEGDYFASLTENILNAAHAEDSDLKYNLRLKKTPLTVPDDYFAKLTDRIESNIHKEIKVIPIYQRSWTRWLAVAASFALIVTTYFLMPKEDNRNEWDGISSQTIISFLEDENALDDESLINIEEIDAILDDIYATETSAYASTLDSHPELEYDFEYFDY